MPDSVSRLTEIGWRSGQHQSWVASDLASSEAAVLRTGHATLSAQLPGAGWPLDGMVEVLQASPGQHAWQLLLPALGQAIQQRAGPVVLVNAPYLPFGPSLKALGLPGDRLLCIRADKPAGRLWAAEQALRCAEVAAVVAWLPQVRSMELRRLHMAAQQHARLLFVFRGLAAQGEASPARLRLVVESAQDSMHIRIIKRRGPPHETPLVLPALPARLAALLDARKGPRQSNPLPATNGPTHHGRSHVLDRSAAIT